MFSEVFSCLGEIHDSAVGLSLRLEFLFRLLKELDYTAAGVLWINRW
jgi:hypothetical protein